jgi:hypothetical protein
MAPSLLRYVSYLEQKLRNDTWIIFSGTQKLIDPYNSEDYLTEHAFIVFAVTLFRGYSSPHHRQVLARAGKGGISHGTK